MSTHWLRVKALFREIQDVPEGDRATWLDAQCAGELALHDEVAQLLAQQRAPAGLLDNDAATALNRMGPIEPAVDPCGQRVGPYRLLKCIGEGGMGSVFLAERDDEFAQRVALKQIRADFGGADILSRFLLEREILARLVHPHIAQLHDGGVADDGTPYFTLEYVEGEPITRYCDAQRLSVKQRVELLLKVCMAVAYAHRNLVVHRDLKPSNILVTADGDVKLLDFGIAKLIDAEPSPGLTATHARLMTREYAAPEQVLGEPITTATDVYVLGVLLYEMLSGRLPYPSAESGTTSWATAIVERPPEALSRAPRRTGGADAIATADDIAEHRATSPQRLRRLLRGDLERITERALEKSPDARYASVAAFADDLTAYCNGRALSGGNRRYRFAKFVRRHRIPLALGTALALAVLAGGVAIVIQSRRTAVEAQRALRGVQSTAAVKDFLVGLFSGADPRANGGKEPSVRDLLDRGAKRIDSQLGNETALQAELKSTLGGIYARMGLYAQAMPLQEQALATFDADDGHAALAAATLMDLASTVRSNGDAARARDLLDQAITRMQGLPDASVKTYARALYMRAFVAINEHRYDVALDYATRSERVSREHPETPGMLGDALHAKASAHWGQHAYPDAVRELTEATQQYAKAGAAFDVSADAARQTLALVYQQTGQSAQALALTEKVLANARVVMGERHPYVAQLLSSTGADLYHLGNYPEAQKRLEKALAVQQELLASGSFYAAETLELLGLVHAANGEWDEAERCVEQARDSWQKRYGATYSHIIDTRSDLAWIHLERGQGEHVIAELRDVLQARTDAHDTDTAVDETRLSEALRQQGRPAEAVDIGREALAQATSLHGTSSDVTATAHRCLGLALAAAGDAEGARRELREAISVYDGMTADGDHPLAVATRVDLGRLLAQQVATRAEAAQMLDRAAQQSEHLWGAGDARTREVRQALAKTAATR
ncbi:MAG: tetratricopeptide repeat protein [Dokdonella sp.]